MFYIRSRPFSMRPANSRKLWHKALPTLGYPRIPLIGKTRVSHSNTVISLGLMRRQRKLLFGLMSAGVVDIMRGSRKLNVAELKMFLDEGTEVAPAAPVVEAEVPTPEPEVPEVVEADTWEEPKLPELPEEPEEAEEESVWEEVSEVEPTVKAIVESVAEVAEVIEESLTEVKEVMEQAVESFPEAKEEIEEAQVLEVVEDPEPEEEEEPEPEEEEEPTPEEESEENLPTLEGPVSRFQKMKVAALLQELMPYGAEKGTKKSDLVNLAKRIIAEQA